MTWEWVLIHLRDYLLLLSPDIRILLSSTASDDVRVYHVLCEVDLIGISPST